MGRGESTYIDKIDSFTSEPEEGGKAKLQARSVIGVGEFLTKIIGAYYEARF